MECKQRAKGGEKFHKLGYHSESNYGASLIKCAFYMHSIIYAHPRNPHACPILLCHLVMNAIFDVLISHHPDGYRYDKHSKHE